MMRKLNICGIWVLLILTLFVSPVYAGSDDLDGGGVHFGPYVLASGDSVSGNLTVFGPVTLEEDSHFDGDLTVFGDASVAEDATLDGTFVVMGTVQIDGTVDGDVLSAGEVTLGESAYVSGDVSSVEGVQADEDAVVDGEIAQVEKEELPWNLPVGIELPDPIDVPTMEVERAPFWLRGLNRTFEAIVMAGVMGLLALVIASVWPQQVERVRQVIEDAPLTSFGMGFLGLLVILIGFLISAVTCILFPIGVVGMIVVGVGVLLGWVSVGMVFGHRLLINFLNQSAPNLVASATVGAALLTFVLVLSKLFGPIIYVIFIVLLVPLAAGAVILTRFGMVPYASTGHPAAKRTSSSSVLPSPMTIASSPASTVDQPTCNAAQDADDNSASEIENRSPSDDFGL
ncbi:MAG: polymer-forming cytoskeletal protein [Anaerolineae bacterium]|nr:polymer-forming cytoskeletal protein [Anaerolineae bacterium]